MYKISIFGNNINIFEIEGIGSQVEISNMKNIVVLKNLPSNLVDEAIVILKSNKNAKKLEYIEKNANKNYEEKNKTKDYMVKEAELVISNYISKIETTKKIKMPRPSLEKKYKRLKVYSIVTSVLLVLIIILNLGRSLSVNLQIRTVPNCKFYKKLLDKYLFHVILISY